MSLYQQHPGYASNQYGSGGGYSAQHQPASAASPYGAQQQYAPDPNEFRTWFNSHLATLTVNNKAIIHSIAFIAREHAQTFGSVIAQCIEQHIRRVPPSIKLPPFYLLDSISKNLGHPYTGLFAAFIAALFLDTYYAVDPSTRGKMEEMLVTWRTAAGGAELFGHTAQQRIEATVWGSGVSSHSPTKTQVLTELEVILAQKQRALEINPYDNTASTHIDVLFQLRNLIQNGPMSSDELMAILNQLRSLARTTAAVVAPPPPSYPAPMTSYPPPPPVSYASTSTAPNVADALSGLSASSLASLLTGTPSINISPPSAGDEAKPNISELYQSLLKAGLVTDAALLSALGSNVKTEDRDEQKALKIDEREAEKELEGAILAMPVKLTSAGIQKEHPDIISLLYDRLPLQCKQCALRFDSSPGGKHRMDDHLDLHFRQNRKASQSTGRGHWRSWFVGIDDWTHDVVTLGNTSDDKGKGHADAPQSAKAMAVAAAEKEAKLRESFVVVPPGDEAKTVVCPICKEALKSEFLEDDEEWVWKNAKEVKGKIYHATCHADALATTIAARARGNITGSRSGTPDSFSLAPEDSKPAASLVGTKRKSSEEPAEVTVKNEPNEEPPSKKQALSS